MNRRGFFSSITGAIAGTALAKYVPTPCAVTVSPPPLPVVMSFKDESAYWMNRIARSGGLHGDSVDYWRQRLEAANTDAAREVLSSLDYISDGRLNPKQLGKITNVKT